MDDFSHCESALCIGIITQPDDGLNITSMQNQDQDWDSNVKTWVFKSSVYFINSGG